MPELPPIEERATLDASQYVAALEAAAKVAQALAEANARATAAVGGLQKAMDDMAAGAAAAAAAESRLAEAAGTAAGAEDAAAEAAARLDQASLAAAGGIDGLTGQMDSLIGHTEAVKGALDSLAADTAADSAVMIAALNRVDAALGDMAAEAAMDSAVTIAALDRAGDAATAMAAKTVAASTVAGAAAGTAFRPWFLFGNNWATALHWIVAGSFEFLAVAVPAAIALGAGLMVAAQGAQNVGEHFSALYDATESTANAMHTTVGDVLGLGNALQTAQNQANPGVYELLGSVVNDARGSFQSLAGVGLQVVHMFDQFAARVTVDLGSGGMGAQIQGLLSGMVTDLRQFGEILGNLGHALLNFASAMPGLAHFLLAVAEGLSSVIEWASRTGPLLTFAMGLEEMYRWGGLVLGLLARLSGGMATMNAMAAGGGFITRFGAAIGAISGQMGLALGAVGRWVGGLGEADGAASKAGEAMQGLGQDMIGLTYVAPRLIAGWAGIAGALVGLVLMLSSVKNSTQQWIASTNNAIQAATGMQVIGELGDAFAQVTTRISQQEAVLRSYPGAIQGTGSALAGVVTTLSRMPGPLGNAAQGVFNLSTQTGLFGQVTRNFLNIIPGGFGNMVAKWLGPTEQAASNISRLRIEEASLVGTTTTFSHNLTFLGGQFHTTAAGALALANAAGVNLTQGLLRGTEQGKIAIQMINNLKTGLGAMQAPASEIGADMNAIGIQSQLASSKVATVNQAMDAFIAGTTGGMDSVMQFNAALHAMGSDTVARSQSINGAISSISASAAKLGYTLQGIGPHAQQSWQQFDAALQQGNTVLDTFRTGMAEGVVTQKQYTAEIQAVGGAMLPFAAHSATARAMVSQLAQEMGDPATHNLRTLASEFGITGKAAQNMATTGMEQAMAKMANLSTVARNLSVTVGTQLDAAMAKAIVGASGLSKAYSNWANALKDNAPATTLKDDLGKIQQAQDFVNTAEQKGTTLLNDNAKAAEGVGSALKGAGGDAEGFGGALEKTHGALSDVVARANQAAQNTQSFGQQAHTAAGSASGLASQASTATTQVRNLGSASSVTQGHLGDVNNEIRTAATAASNAGGPLSGMTGNISRVGASAMTAAGEVHALATAIDALQSKSITVTTNVVTVTSTVHRAMGGPVFPGVPTVVGEAGREMYVPAVPGYIFNHAQTEQMMGGGSGGKAPAAAAPAPPAAPTGAGAGTLVIQMNTREVARALMPELWRWMGRNQGAVTGILKPG